MEPKSTLKAVRMAAMQPPSLRTRETGEKRGEAENHPAFGVEVLEQYPPGPGPGALQRRYVRNGQLGLRGRAGIIRDSVSIP